MCISSLIDAIFAGIAIFEIDNNVKITHFGDWTQDYLGYTYKEFYELRSSTLLGSVRQKDIESTQQAIQDFRDGKNNIKLLIHALSKDGTPKSVNI